MGTIELMKQMTSVQEEVYDGIGKFGGLDADVEIDTLDTDVGLIELDDTGVLLGAVVLMVKMLVLCVLVLEAFVLDIETLVLSVLDIELCDKTVSDVTLEHVMSVQEDAEDKGDGETSKDARDAELGVLDGADIKAVELDGNAEFVDIFRVVLVPDVVKLEVLIAVLLVMVLLIPNGLLTLDGLLNLDRLLTLEGLLRLERLLILERLLVLVLLTVVGLLVSVLLALKGLLILEGLFAVARLELLTPEVGLVEEVPSPLKPVLLALDAMPVALP